MDTQESKRKACPERIFADAGGGFAMGTIGGTAFHFLKGLYSSPHGARFIGGAQAVRMNTPRVAGSLATWCGLFSTFDCAFAYVRQKEDRWNLILAGAATNCLFSMRQGLLPMGKAALGGALLVAFIDGVNLRVRRAAISAQQQQMSLRKRRPCRLRWEMRRLRIHHILILFRKKEEVKSYVKDTVLESFDSPMPQTFVFE